MSWDINTALAVPFTTTSETFSFVVGVTTYTGTLAAGTYKVNLATSATDALRVLAAAMLAAPGLLGAIPSITFDVTISATTGLVTIESNNAFKCTTLHSTTLGKVLGFTAAGSLALTDTGTRQPWYLALFVGAYGGVWQPRTPGGVERTAGGVVYSFSGSGTAYDRDLTVEFVPWTPTVVTEVGSPGTPAYPDDAYLSDLAGVGTSTRAWSLLDVLTAARNRQCSIAIGTWQTVVSSTSERYHLPYLMPDGLDAELSRMDDRWPKYMSTRLSLVLPTSSATATRA